MLVADIRDVDCDLTADSLHIEEVAPKILIERIDEQNFAAEIHEAHRQIGPDQPKSTGNKYSGPGEGRGICHLQGGHRRNGHGLYLERPFARLFRTMVSSLLQVRASPTWHAPITRHVPIRQRHTALHG